MRRATIRIRRFFEQITGASAAGKGKEFNPPATSFAALE
jgi:hypothetical protein